MESGDVAYSGIADSETLNTCFINYLYYCTVKSLSQMLTEIRVFCEVQQYVYDFFENYQPVSDMHCVDLRHTWRPVACYAFTTIKLASYHLLLYVVYIFEES